LLGVPARAQFLQFFSPEPQPEPWAMRPGEIRRIIVSQGYRVLVRPFRNGGVYITDVISPHGVQQRLIVDAYHGNIIQRYDVGQTQDRRPPESSWPDAGDGWPFSPHDFSYDSGSEPPRPMAPVGRGFFEEQPITPGGRPQRAARGGDDGRDPSVIPGIGPPGPGDQVSPKPKRQARPNAPTAIVRATPLTLTPPPTADRAPSGQTRAGPATHVPASESGKVEPGPNAAPTGTPVAVDPSAKAVAPAAPTAAAPAVKPVLPEKKKPQGPLNDVPAAPLD
jgi:hypothetical protein